MGKGKRGRGIVAPQDPAPTALIPNADTQSPLLCFQYSDDRRYCIPTLPLKELQSLGRTFHQLGRMTWAQIRTTGGYGARGAGIAYRAVEPSELRRVTPPPAALALGCLAKMSTSKGCRMYGVRNGRIFHVLWIDAGHEIRPA